MSIKLTKRGWVAVYVTFAVLATLFLIWADTYLFDLLPAETLRADTEGLR